MQKTINVEKTLKMILALVNEERLRSYLLILTDLIMHAQQNGREFQTNEDEMKFAFWNQVCDDC